MVIFSVEVIVVILIIYLLDVAMEVGKWFNVAGISGQGDADLTEGVESLKAGEDKSVIFESKVNKGEEWPLEMSE